MKKFLFAATIVCLLFTKTNAQSETITQTPQSDPKKWKGWTINPYVMAGTAISTYKIGVGETNKPGGSAVLGCMAGYNLNSHISFNAGIALGGYVWQKDISIYPIDYAQSSSSFLQIPIIAKIATSRYNKVGFLVEAGFNLNFLTAMEDKIKYLGGIPSDKSTDDSYNNKFCPTFNLMLGVRIPVSKSTRIDAGIDTYSFLIDQYTDASGQTGGAGIKIGVQTKISR